MIADSFETTRLIRVGVISDTHGYLPEAALMALADSDYIIHAGDIGGPEILRELECIAPVTAVLGNCDFDEYGESVQRFARPIIGSVSFLVAHRPEDVRITWAGGPGIEAGEPVPQICLHGHTHVPKIVSGKDAHPAGYLICPGSIYQPRGGSRSSVGKITLQYGRVQELKIEEIEDC